LKLHRYIFCFVLFCFVSMIRHDVSREATASTLVAFPGPFAAPRGPFGERGAGFVIDAVVHSTRNVAVKDAAGAFVRFAAIACDVSTVRLSAWNGFFKKKIAFRQVCCADACS
jgi:hypothetical protein